MLLPHSCGRAAVGWARSHTASAAAAAAAAAAAGLAPSCIAVTRAQPRVAAVRNKSSSGSSSIDLVRSIRAMPIKVVRVSKDNSPAAQACAQEWLTKLGRYTSVQEVLIKPNPKGAASPEVAKAAEGEKVLKAISASERLVLLDERGRDASSEDVARLLTRASDDGTPLCFVIGGPFGHGSGVVARADDSIRLSRMVLNHAVAYIVLAEQLYRAWTIVRGEPYHH